MKKGIRCCLAALAFAILLSIFAAAPVFAKESTVDLAAVTSKSVTVRWDKPVFSVEGMKVKVTGYKVYYGTSAKKLKQFGDTLSASALQKKVTGLKARKKYYFQIRVLLKGTVLATGEVGVLEKDYLDSPLSTYTLPGKNNSMLTQYADPVEKTAIIEWKDVNPAEGDFGYQYQVATSKGKWKSAGKTTQNFADLKNISNTTYYLGRVRSYLSLVNRDGKKIFYGPWSDWAPIMNDPVLVQANFVGGKMILTWTRQKGADSYEVYISRDSWKKEYRATMTDMGSSYGTVWKLNKKEFKYQPGARYEIAVVAVKEYNGKTYYSPQVSYWAITAPTGGNKV